jgi:hypothetical protein
VEKYGTAKQATDNTIRRMRIACWVIKATDTHLEYKYVTLIAFPRQHWLRERAAVSRTPSGGACNEGPNDVTWPGSVFGPAELDKENGGRGG